MTRSLEAIRKALAAAKTDVARSTLMAELAEAEEEYRLDRVLATVKAAKGGAVVPNAIDSGQTL